MLSAEAAAPSARVFALVTGTLGLLAVGVLLVTVTPARQESPIALSASTTLVRLDPANLPVAQTTVSAAGPTGALVNPGRPADHPHDALATPIGDGRFALVTSAALADYGGTTLSVRFTSGRVGIVEIVDRSDEALVLVALPAGETGHPIADERPGADEIVTVMASPPITVPFADVPTLSVQEGTPVFDDDGALVGLCSQGTGNVRVIEPPSDLTSGAEQAGTTQPEPTTTLAPSSTPTTTTSSTSTTTTSTTAVPASEPAVSDRP